jgi:alpha-galactosidase
MPAKKIVIIGAGSVEFGLSTVATLARDEALRGSELALVDLNEQAVDHMAQVARRMSAAWDADLIVSADTERTAVLDNADFVIVATEVAPRETLWRMDWEIPLKYGLRQPYAENGGAGGLMHTCRQVPAIMAIVRDMERQCPQAWLINFSNPLPRINRAISRYSTIKAVGKCHQIEAGYAFVAVLLRERFGIDVPPNVNLYSDPINAPVVHSLAAAGRARVTIRSAGLNHFIWLLDVRDKATGEDLYPALRASATTAPPTLDPLSMELFGAFDLLPIAGDTHLVEYLPWLHDPLAKPWETYQVPLYNWGDNEEVRKYLQGMLAEIAAGKQSVAGLHEARSEGAAEIIHAMATARPYLDETVNIPNKGAIRGLPDDTIVELPAVVDGAGIHGQHIGEMPAAITELLRREAALVEMVVETAVTGDRHLALQTLLLDPMINDIGRARAILDDYLLAFEAYLPQFQ